jgi:predicted histone-like DNA-binding protein
MFKYRIIGRKNPQTKEKKYYAQGEPVNPVSLSDIANEISGMCTLTAHDIKAVLSALDEALLRHVVNGDSIRFGDFGSFHPRIVSKGADTPEEFEPSLLEGIRIRYTPSASTQRQLSKKFITFQCVNKPEATDEAGE